MTTSLQKVTANLWYNFNAEEAVDFYLSVFPGSRIVSTLLYTESGHGTSGEVMTITFELFGQQFTAINGGPMFELNEAASIVVACESQEEIDYYWEKLGEGGTPQACGWLKDRFGLSWQINPTRLFEMLADADRAKADRAMAAMLKMVKIDIAALEAAIQAND